MRTLSEHCEPYTYEGRIYQKWLRDHSFCADTNPMQLPFALLMPPPDVSSPLHLGHAYSLTVQDTVVRRMRMLGRSARWIPCTDSGVLSPDPEKTAQSAAKYQQMMMRLGCSCDWEQEHHTTDAACRAAVKEAFVNDYEDGLLYRGEHIAQWCPACGAALENPAMLTEEQEGAVWHLRFAFADGSGYLFLQTTHPETVPADAAAAVHPKDKRFQNIIGKTVILPLTGRKIPVISDETVSMDSGTGVARITPACDPHAYDIAQKKGFPVIVPLLADGTVPDVFPAYAGMTRQEAREAVLRDLKACGALVKSEPCSIRRAVCRRCGTEVMPRICAQWFLRSAAHAEPAADAVRAGDIRFIPGQAAAQCLDRLLYANDQRISRHAQQGIPVPAFYCDACNEMAVTAEAHADCPKCGKPMRPDPDTLETGFAASLLPFALLGYPARTDDLQYYYPADTLVTGRDLVTPWISGMLAAAMRHTDELPFKQVILHGLMRDSSGKKITAARRNGFDPAALIDDYGADAFRFALISRTAPGRDLRLSEEQVIAAQRLAEKLWHAARCVIGTVSGSLRYHGLPAALRIEEQWIVSRFNRLAGDVSELAECGMLGRAAVTIGRFLRETFCGTYLKLAKARLRADYDGRDAAEQVLVWVLRGILCLLHPFMPFVTEEIWQALTDCESSIICEAYPEYQPDLDFSQTADEFEHVIAALRAVKQSRKALHIPDSLRVKFYFDTLDVDLFSASSIFFEQIAGAKEIEFGQDYRFRNAVHVITERAYIAIPVEQMLIRDRVHLLLTEQAESLRREAEQIQAVLHQPGFCEKAPEPVVRAARERRAVLRDQLVRLIRVLDQ